MEDEGCDIIVSSELREKEHKCQRVSFGKKGEHGIILDDREGVLFGNSDLSHESVSQRVESERGPTKQLNRPPPSIAIMTGAPLVILTKVSAHYSYQTD